jgi:hypothetical protein
MSKLIIHDKDFWQSINLVDEQPVHPNLKLTDTELDRRTKISQTSNIKMATDPEFREIKRAGAKKTADIKRRIPVEDYESIIREYYDPAVKRKHGFIKVIAARYANNKGFGSKLTGQIEKIIMNWHNTLPVEEYTALRDAWETANPNFRSDMLRDLNKTGKRKSNGLLISSALDSVDATTAQKIYAECLTKKDSRTNKNYQCLAKKYKVTTWQKVRDIANGHHYSLRDCDAKTDIEQWRLSIGEGNYEMRDPNGQSYLFKDLRELGYFIQTTEGKPADDTTKNWYIARNWFEKTQPNTWYKKQKRTFKGWEYCNHLPAKL